MARMVIFLGCMIFYSGCAYSPEAQPEPRKGLLEELAQLSPAGRNWIQEEIETEAQESGSAPRHLFVKLSPITRDWIWPLKNPIITSKFGSRGKRYHEGVDFKAKIGTPIYAVSDGEVVYSGRKISGYGKMIILKHKGGLMTVYAHNSSNLVNERDSVKKGQKIALSGKSGRVTGPHLHFEIRKGIVAVDPERYIAKH